VNKIVRGRQCFDFREALKQAREHAEYYEEDMLLDVSARLVDEMERQGVTRSELARRLNVTPAYVTKLLRGHANLTVGTMAKVAFALGLKWECMLVPQESRLPPPGSAGRPNGWSYQA
jgi:transcriptional regulator with XRE-family HTH domain